jgi:hypothetical protein
MKRALIVVALFAVPLLIAQQQDSSASAEPTQATATQPAAAPKLGHPLDPADVDVLTGKDKARSAVSYGYAYPGALGYGYGYGSPSIAADVSTRTSSPLSLGFVHGRPVIFFSDAHSGIFFGRRPVHSFLTPGAFFPIKSVQTCCNYDRPMIR